MENKIQAIGPELTFYNTSRSVGESAALSNKLLHTQLDAFCRLVLSAEHYSVPFLVLIVFVGDCMFFIFLPGVMEFPICAWKSSISFLGTW